MPEWFPGSPDEDVLVAAKALARKIAELPPEGKLAAAIAHVGDTLDDLEFLARKVRKEVEEGYYDWLC